VTAPPKNLSIAYAIPEDIGGRRARFVQIANTVSALAREGVRVHFLHGSGSRKGLEEAFGRCGLKLPRGVESVPIQLLRKVPVVGLRMSWNWVAHRSILGKLLGLRESTRVDVVYVRHVKLARFLLRFRARLGIPLVFEAHAAAEDRDRKEVALEREVVENVDGLVTISKALEDCLRERYRVSAPVCVAHDGVNLGEVEPSEGVSSSPVVCYVGSFRKIKGVEVLLEAMRGLPEARLVLVGAIPGTEEAERVRGIVDNYGMSDRVDVIEHVPHREALKFLRSARVAAAPFIEDKGTVHGSPLKLFEYMAAGAPMVVTDLPSVREVVRDEETAVLVPPGDAESLREAIRRLLSDEALSGRLRDGALRAVKEYSWEERAKRIADFVSTQVAGRGQREADR